MTTTRYGLLNAHMFGHPSEPGEYVNWSEPDYMTDADLIDLGLGTVADYAEESPHMIVFEDVADETFPPLRQVAGWQGNIGYRCDTCGCGVSPYHTPGSEDCREAALEKRRSQAD
jgi:hypothetical protein